jgi:DNA-binding transcriptional LysR family regulator
MQRVLVRTDNLETVRRMVEDGSGVSFAPSIVLEPAAGWTVVRVHTAFEPMQREVTLVHRGSRQLPMAATTFVEAILTAAQKRARTHA